MQYMLLIYSDEAQWFGMSQAQMQAAMGQYMTYSKALVEAGVMRGGSELKPITTATVVRVRNGKPQMTDGPFAETKEQLGGYYILETPTLDEALKWASQCPGAHHGSVEVRPLQDNPAPK
jgi:hypothetical protein